MASFSGNSGNPGRNKKSTGLNTSPAPVAKKKKKKVHWNSSANKPFEHSHIADIFETYINSGGKEEELSCHKIKTAIMGAAAAGIQTVNNNRLNELDEVSSAQKIIAYLKKKQEYLATHPSVMLRDLKLQKEHAPWLNKVVEAFEKCYPTTPAGQKTNNSGAGGGSKTTSSGSGGGDKGFSFGGRRRRRKTRKRKRKKTKKRKRRRRKRTRKR